MLEIKKIVDDCQLPLAEDSDVDAEQDNASDITNG